MADSTAPIEFETTIIKIDKDGNTILSNTLSPGEKLRGSEKTYAQVKAERKAVLSTQAESRSMLKEDAEEPVVGSTKLTTDETVTHTQVQRNYPRPKDTDGKQVWFSYAQSKGFEGDYDDLTKKQFIEQYGA